MTDYKNILFADDEDKIRQIVNMYLNKEGYNVQAAVDGNRSGDLTITVI